MPQADPDLARADPDTSPFTADCPGREIFNHITARWSFLILTALGPGEMRFHQLRDAVGGVSEKMLSQTLKTLVRDGLVTRLVEPTVPPQVSYRLTPIGAEVSAQLTGLVTWLGRRVPDILMAQARYDAAQA